MLEDPASRSCEYCSGVATVEGESREGINKNK